MYILPSRKTLTEKLIPNICKEIATNIKGKLQKTDYLGITTDIWSSDSNKSFISVSCHFINIDGEQENVVLDTKEISGTHTGEAIANSIKYVLIDWNIEDKVTAIVTDNGSNVKNAVIEHLKITHIPCVAHMLNLCVTDAIQENCIFKETLKNAKVL